MKQEIQFHCHNAVYHPLNAKEFNGKKYDQLDLTLRNNFFLHQNILRNLFSQKNVSEPQNRNSLTKNSVHTL
jgi:hypothetical protein